MNILEELAKPFDESVIEWRAGATNQDKTRALALAYAPARVYMDRLDEVMGADWQDEYKTGPDGGVICGVSLFIDGQWVTRWDGAENTDFESIKGGLSDAFKRACVKWGIGRYLYSIEAQWVACEQRGKTVVLKETPSLGGQKKRAESVSQEPPERPYPAPLVKVKLLELAGQYRLEKKKMSEAQDTAFRITYSAMWPVDDMRYAVTDWVFGKASTKGLDDAEKLALIRWMDWEEVDQNGHSAYVPSQDAISEAQIMYRYVQEEQGQMEMEI